MYTTYHIKRVLGELHVHGSLSYHSRITENWGRNRSGHGDGLPSRRSIIISETQTGEYVGDVGGAWWAILLARVL
jgi:hypothetical protein